VIEDDVFEAFTNFAETAGIAKDPDGISRSEDVLKIRIKAYIARNIWGNDGFYSVMNTDDNVLKEAQMALSSNSSTSVTNTAYR
jgi:carboxyl-terminal processing protease